MPVAIQPLDQPLALHYRFSDPLVDIDLVKVRDAESPHFGALQEGECVRVVLDLSAVETISTDLLPQLARLRIMLDPRECKVIVAGANPYLRAMAISLGVFNANGREFVFCATLGDAVTALG